MPNRAEWDEVQQQYKQALDKIINQAPEDIATVDVEAVDSSSTSSSSLLAANNNTSNNNSNSKDVSISIADDDVVPADGVNPVMTATTADNDDVKMAIDENADETGEAVEADDDDKNISIVNAQKLLPHKKTLTHNNNNLNHNKNNLPSIERILDLFFQVQKNKLIYDFFHHHSPNFFLFLSQKATLFLLLFGSMILIGSII
jgi:hypothetical protein